MATTFAISRRTMVKGALALPFITVLRRPASAAEFTLKYATGQDPTHPVNIRAKEAFDRIRDATSGRVEIRLYPANQLGSDTDLLSQVRNGAIDFFNLSSLVLATFVPLSGITSLGFAFKNYDQVWQAMDGELGAHIREMIAKTPIFAMSKIWDNGFRQITSSTKEIKTPQDLKGFKLRVPPAPALTSLFKALEAAPSPINFNELYSALQTKVVEGQENPLAIIATARLYEVQKSISLTNHVWDGYWVLGNKASFARLPKELQDVISHELDQSALDQRSDIARLSESLKTDLKGKGINLIDVDQDAFRTVLASTSFYNDWKQKYGEDAWKSLEKVSGPLGK
ncbi:TRAP transporter substrate-binding protein [Allorhizobium taibaishanense]|uniref:ABC transporter substrate-binding protein n=1 Tax=Allorhizobium taibaishanense TaxID=887144 RepID=A0A1Q9A7J2_9HYPH|nr:TRAP transporter substrate-binding protein [Allorhizobium taibaishanense]MBB4008237.1 tripartite ATP-independent transporter DctP family solute receptor [Allorhizobium taibaishanense]OLP50560.1 ABC transporter substrate-binding protein [Allorhizobium taibaishanense]